MIKLQLINLIYLLKWFVLHKKHCTALASAGEMKEHNPCY